MSGKKNIWHPDPGIKYDAQLVWRLLKDWEDGEDTMYRLLVEMYKQDAERGDMEQRLNLKRLAAEYLWPKTKTPSQGHETYLKKKR